MKRFLSTLMIILMFTTTIIAQSGSLQGIVKDNATKAPLSGVNVILNKGNIGTTTDEDGKFQLNNLPAGTYKVTVSYLGYKTETKSIKIIKDQKTEIGFLLTETPVKLGEITVKSIKADKVIKNVSLPMDVIGAAEMEKSSKTTVSGYLQNEPGVTLARDGVWGTHVSIRGLNRQNIVKLVDGNRIETATNIAAGMSLIDVSNIERVEVIKAGVSSLYGSGATGGVVNIITEKPHYSSNFYLKGKAASGYNTVNTGVKNNISVSTGSRNWKAKISGTIRNAVDTETPKGTLTNSQFHDNNITATIGVKPVENHELTIDYQRFYAKDVGIPGGAPFPSGATARYPMEEREMFSAEYKLRNQFEIVPNISVKYFHQLIRRDVEVNVKPDIPKIESVTTKPEADHNTNGLQFQSNWIMGRSNTLIAGIDMWQRNYKGSRQKITQMSNQTKVTADKPLPDSDYRSAGIFVQDKFKLLSEMLTVNLGGRLDQIRVTNEEVINPTNDPNTTSFDANEDYDISWSSNLGLIYSLTPDYDITFNAAKTFRSPTLEERFQYINLGGIIYLGDPKIDSEKGNFFDLGFRVWKPDFKFKGNVFLNSFNDLVVDQPVVKDSLYRSTNVGTARLYGFDLSAEYNFYDDYVVYGSAAYVRGRDTRNNENLPEIPPLNGRLGLRFPICSYGSGDISAAIYDEQDKTAPGEKETAGYAYINFYVNSKPINLGLIDLKLYAGVENLTDKAYRNHLSTFRGINKLEPGRNFFFKASVNW